MASIILSRWLQITATYLLCLTVTISSLEASSERQNIKAELRNLQMLQAAIANDDDTNVGMKSGAGDPSSQVSFFGGMDPSLKFRPGGPPTASTAAVSVPTTLEPLQEHKVKKVKIENADWLPGPLDRSKQPPFPMSKESVAMHAFDSNNLPAGRNPDNDKQYGRGDPRYVGCTRESKRALAQCFIGVLNRWLLEMWSVLDNFPGLDCSVHRMMGACLTASNCSVVEAYGVSKALTKTLTTARGGGSFLIGFLAMEEVCSPVGQRLVTQNKQCLSDKQVGVWIVSLISEVQQFVDQFIASDGPCFQFQHYVENRLTTRHSCGIRAAPQVNWLFCRIMSNPFLRINPRPFKRCTRHFCEKYDRELDYEVTKDGAEDLVPQLTIAIGCLTFSGVARLFGA